MQEICNYDELKAFCFSKLPKELKSDWIDKIDLICFDYSAMDGGFWVRFFDLDIAPRKFFSYSNGKWPMTDYQEFEFIRDRDFNINFDCDFSKCCWEVTNDN